MFIRVSGMDPSFANYGLAAMDLPMDLSKPRFVAMDVICTEPRVNKTVRKNSDDMRRAKDLHDGVRDFLQANECQLVMGEIPQGAQSARAAWTLGIALGVISGVPLKIIQVQPIETKLATVGNKTASKREMIEWAMEQYPEAPWITHLVKGEIVANAVNEHMADAIAVTHAGIKSEQFQELVAIMKAMGVHTGKAPPFLTP